MTTPHYPTLDVHDAAGLDASLLVDLSVGGLIVRICRLGRAAVPAGLGGPAAAPTLVNPMPARG